MTMENDMYQPDNWIIIKINGGDPHYRVLAGWSGGYLSGDSWRLNSGITHVEETEHTFDFYGSSGSCYSCHKRSYCLRANSVDAWRLLEEKHGDLVKQMPEDTDWMNMDWIIS